MRVGRTIFPGVEEPLRIEHGLHLAERRGEARSEDRFDPFRPHEAVAVLAGESALVLAHELACLFCDGTHLHGAVGLHVQHGPDVQRAHRRVGVPRAARAVLRKHFVDPARVLREMLERHGAILDERHGLSVALHRHHDVQPGLADLPDVALLPRVGHLHHGVGQPAVGEQFHQLVEFRHLCGLVVAGELHQQDRVGLAQEELLDDGPELLVPSARARSSCGRRVPPLRVELHDLLRDRHRVVERRGMCATPSTLCAGSGFSASFRRRNHASVPSEPTSRCARLCGV